MKRYICQDCGHPMIAAQKPSACEVCNGTILLPFEGKKPVRGESEKPRKMIDVTGFGVKKNIPKSAPPAPLPPLPPPTHPPTHQNNRNNNGHRRSSSRRPPAQSPPSNKGTHYSPGSLDSTMMNISSKPAAHLDSSLLSSYNQPLGSRSKPSRRSKKANAAFLKKLSLGGLGLIFLGLLVGFYYFWWIKPFDLSHFQKVILEDNFSNSKKWSLTKGARIKDGGLFHRQPHVKHYGASIWTGYNFTNVDFSADVKKVNGPDNVPYGLVTRVSGKNYQDFYYFLISGNGTWVMGKHSNGSWEKKGKWKKSKLINQGDQATNNLRLVSKDNLVIAYINGKRVGYFRDKSVKNGKIAVTSMRGSGDAVAVYFDNVVAKIEEKPK